MNEALAGGFVGAMTAAAVAFSIVGGPVSGPVDDVRASGTQLVIVSGDQAAVSASNGASTSISTSTSRSRSTAVSGSASVAVGCTVPDDGSGPDQMLVTVRRMLCALPTLPAEIGRRAFPPTVPWLGLMTF